MGEGSKVTSHAEATTTISPESNLMNYYPLYLAACNVPEISHTLMQVCKQLRVECGKLCGLYSRRCYTCSQKTCWCWKKINYKQFLRHGITSFEIDYFGVSLITTWQKIKFLGKSADKFTNFEKIVYSLSLDILLAVYRQIGGFRQLHYVMKSALVSRRKKLLPSDLRLPIILYLEKTPFIEINRYNRCTKDVATRIKKNVPNLKAILQNNCYNINNLYIKK